MQNYYNYFTEVEERFQQRRGSLLLLSTLDWTLIETWRDAGVPLAAVLRGIDEAFDKYEARKSRGRARKVNGLAWCAQAVMEAAEQLRDAAVGASTATADKEAPGLEQERIASHLETCSRGLAGVAPMSPEAAELAAATATRLAELAGQVRADQDAPGQMEQLEQTLRTLEERLLAMLLATTPEQELADLRAQAAREIAPYRSRMQALQIRQIEQQFLHKRLMERYGMPRLSLFYMQGGE